MSAGQRDRLRHYISFVVLSLLFAPVPVSAQKRGHTGHTFRVAYTLRNKLNQSAAETHEGSLSVLPKGFQFLGQRYNSDRTTASVAGPPYAENFSCAEMTNLQFHPDYSALDVEVRGQPRFIYCPRGFAGLRAAITKLCEVPPPTPSTRATRATGAKQASNGRSTTRKGGKQ